MIDLTEATFVCPTSSSGHVVGRVTARILKAAAVVACGVAVWAVALGAIL